MKIVVLKEKTEINGIMREKGEVVKVPDSFDRELIKRILKDGRDETKQD